MKYVLIDGELVSPAWAVVLKDMRKAGVDFGINEGHRTLARQKFFWDCFVCQCCNNGNLAARPTPWAPHIRVGRADHAVDFSNPEAVMSWLHRAGLKPTRPAGAGTDRWEPWHIEVDRAALMAYAKAHKGDRFDTLPKHVERAVRRFIGARNTVRNRVEDRDRVDSHAKKAEWLKRNERVAAAVEQRSKRRRRLERLLARARDEKVKRILRSVLNTK
jgi:hypothetical protein